MSQLRLRQAPWAEINKLVPGQPRGRKTETQITFILHLPALLLIITTPATWQITLEDIHTLFTTQMYRRRFLILHPFPLTAPAKAGNMNQANQLSLSKLRVALSVRILIYEKVENFPGVLRQLNNWQVVKPGRACCITVFALSAKRRPRPVALCLRMTMPVIIPTTAFKGGRIALLLHSKCLYERYLRLVLYGSIITRVCSITIGHEGKFRCTLNPKSRN